MQNVPQTTWEWIAFLGYVLLNHGVQKTELVKAESILELIVINPVKFVFNKIKSIFTKGKPDDTKPASP